MNKEEETKCASSRTKIGSSVWVIQSLRSKITVLRRGVKIEWCVSHCVWIPWGCWSSLIPGENGKEGQRRLRIFVHGNGRKTKESSWKRDRERERGRNKNTFEWRVWKRGWDIETETSNAICVTVFLEQRSDLSRTIDEPGRALHGTDARPSGCHYEVHENVRNPNHLRTNASFQRRCWVPLANFSILQKCLTHTCRVLVPLRLHISPFVEGELMFLSIFYVW